MAEIREQARLAGPVVVVNLGMMAMGVTDTVMAGHVDTAAQAAVGLGHAWVFCPLAFGFGVVMALDALVSQARGAGDTEGLARSVQRALLMAALLSLPVSAILMGAGHAFAAMAALGLEQPAEIVPLAVGYSRVSALSVPAVLGFMAMRQTLQALGHLRVIVVVAVVGNLVNVLGNGLLMFGWLGAPRLGAIGCAWSTAVVQWSMLFVLLWLSWPIVGSIVWPLRPRAATLGPLLRLLRLGAPIGVAVSLEMAAFNGVQFLMGGFGTSVLAGHRNAIAIASTSFMVPLGIGTAAAVRVGHAVGAGQMGEARRAARVALCSGALVMAAFGVAFLLWTETLASLFSPDPAVVAVTMMLLPVAAAFQLFDGLQVVAAGVLRGTADTTWPSALNFLGYWVIGLPLGGWWAFRRDGGPLALWWGLAGGLALVAVTLLVRVVLRLSGNLSRYDAEGMGDAASGRSAQ